MAMNQTLLDIEIILDNPNAVKNLYDRYRLLSGKDEFVLALIGKLIEEHEVRKVLSRHA